VIFIIKLDLKRIRYPGLRNIKTSLAIGICIVLYTFIIDRSNGLILACIAAIICMQDSVEKSFVEAGNRLKGNILGGFFGIIFLKISFFHANQYIWILGVTLGVIVLIYTFNIINKDSLVLGLVIFLIIVLENGYDDYVAPLLYSINRMVDTSIGIVVGVLINYYLFRPKVIVKKIANNDADLIQSNHEVRKSYQHRVSRWSGGKTKEVFIFPPHKQFTNLDFMWRVSLATTETDKTEFTKLNGYYRHIMVLDGEIKLIHKNEYSIRLDKYEQDCFSGNFDTECYGKCQDFNLILQNGISGKIFHVKNSKTEKFIYNEPYQQISFNTTCYYCFADKTTINIYDEEEIIFTSILNADDFIIFSSLDELNKYNYTIKIETSELNLDDIVAIKMNIG
jgi:uncharacterized protein